jgi:hypothetical protein
MGHICLVDWRQRVPPIDLQGKAGASGWMEAQLNLPRKLPKRGRCRSFAMEFGGGMDLRFARYLGIRAVEAEYVRSTLPNGAGNVQNDLRLAAGIAFHFDSKH